MVYNCLFCGRNQVYIGILNREDEVGQVLLGGEL